MAEQCWTPSEITQAHLQDLVSQGFMTITKLATCRVLEDPASSAPAEGYVVALVAFDEQVFDVLSHQFLRSLLQYYGLELHNLTPSRILHITAFMTLCEAFMGIVSVFSAPANNRVSKIT
jgi:hypothetical protein